MCVHWLWWMWDKWRAAWSWQNQRCGFQFSFGPHPFTKILKMSAEGPYDYFGSVKCNPRAQLSRRKTPFSGTSPCPASTGILSSLHYSQDPSQTSPFTDCTIYLYLLFCVWTCTYLYGVNPLWLDRWTFTCIWHKTYKTNYTTLPSLFQKHLYIYERHDVEIRATCAVHSESIQASFPFSRFCYVPALLWNVF